MRRAAIIGGSTTEMKAEAIIKYGGPRLDQNGKETGDYTINPDNPNWQDFIDAMAPYASLEHEVEIFTVPYECAQNELTGQQVYELYWMFHDDEKGPENGN